MNLKKLNGNLQRALAENDLSEANVLQRETFSGIKSGADAVIISPPGSGKTVTAVISIIQKLGAAQGESTRALMLVEDKQQVLDAVEMFGKFAKYTDLRVYGTNDRTDIDNDKNQISLGVDILVGTPNKINALFSGAGFNLKTIKMFVVDDADSMFRNRYDAVVLRLLTSLERTQKIFTALSSTEKLEIMADKVMDEPHWFEFDVE